jgi:glycosyltransferase involved in cell wall biosynthesis
MNIVLYVNSFLPSIGGREIVVHYLAQALMTMGHQVRVVGPAGLWSQRKVRFEYPLHRWPTLRGLFNEQVWFTQLMLDTAIWGCDVIHAHSTYPSGYAAAQLKAIRNIPLVVTPHGEDIHVIPEIGFGQRLDPIQRPKINFALQGAEMLTAISASVEASLMDAGAPQKKIRRIPNGVDIERFQRPIAANARKWLQLPKESRLIVTVGNYHPRKGHDTLIRSMPLILAKEPRARLIIVGRNTDALHPLIRKLDLDDKVKLTGPISFPAIVPEQRRVQSVPHKPDWLAAIYLGSEVYVSAGVNEGAEGLSLAVLEAMAAGLPIVATNISGNRDIIQHGQNGFLIPPADPAQLAKGILRLLSSNQLRIRMGTKAKGVAKQYEWREIARQYLAVYHEARERSKGKSSRCTI